MAKQTSIVLTCDLPHSVPVSDGVTTVTFGYEGKPYEVELCPMHTDEYHQWMQKYLVNGSPMPTLLGKRKAPPANAPARVSPGLTGPADTSAVRAWARENGYKVNNRGRISADIVSAYQALN